MSGHNTGTHITYTINYNCFDESPAGAAMPPEAMLATKDSVNYVLGAYLGLNCTYECIVGCLLNCYPNVQCFSQIHKLAINTL